MRKLLVGLAAFTFLPTLVSATTCTIVEDTDAAAAACVIEGENTVIVAEGVTVSGGGISAKDDLGNNLLINYGTITGDSGYQKGLHIKNSSGTEAENHGAINSSGNYGHGMVGTNAENVSLLNTGTIKLSGEDANAMYLDTVTNSAIMNTGSITASGDDTFLISVRYSEGSTINNSGSLAQNDKDGHGVYFYESSNLSFINSGDITTRTTGVYALNSDHFTFTNYGDIFIAKQASNLDFGVIANVSNYATLINYGSIVVEADYVNGVQIKHSNYGSIYNFGEVTMLDRANAAIRVHDADETSIYNFGTITTTEDYSHGMEIDGADDVKVVNGGSISVTGDYSYAIEIEGSNDATIVLLPGTKIIGDIAILDTSKTDLTLEFAPGTSTTVYLNDGADGYYTPDEIKSSGIVIIDEVERSATNIDLSSHRAHAIADPTINRLISSAVSMGSSGQTGSGKPEKLSPQDQEFWGQVLTTRFVQDETDDTNAFSGAATALMLGANGEQLGAYLGMTIADYGSDDSDAFTALRVGTNLGVSWENSAMAFDVRAQNSKDTVTRQSGTETATSVFETNSLTPRLTLRDPLGINLSLEFAATFASSGPQAYDFATEDDLNFGAQPTRSFDLRFKKDISTQSVDWHYGTEGSISKSGSLTGTLGGTDFDYEDTLQTRSVRIFGGATYNFAGGNMRFEASLGSDNYNALTGTFTKHF